MPARDRRWIGRRFHMAVFESDTTATKFSLCLCALVTGAGFLVDGGACKYVACEYMERAMPWQYWAASWLTYGVVKLWRIFDGTSRPRVALFVNAVGAFLYGASAAAVTIARWPAFLLSAAAISLACAAMWIFARTAINSGHGFRGD